MRTHWIVGRKLLAISLHLALEMFLVDFGKFWEQHDLWTAHRCRLRLKAAFACVKMAIAHIQAG
jgi:hypothetical protein